MKTIVRSAVLPLLALVLVSGCGNKPSEESLTKVFLSDDTLNFLLKEGQLVDKAGDGTANDGIKKKTAECVAKIFLDSDLSDESLQILATGVGGVPLPEGDGEIINALIPKMTKDCKEQY